MRFRSSLTLLLWFPSSQRELTERKCQIGQWMFVASFLVSLFLYTYNSSMLKTHWMDITDYSINRCLFQICSKARQKYFNFLEQQKAEKQLRIIRRKKIARIICNTQVAKSPNRFKLFLGKILYNYKHFLVLESIKIL